MRERLPMKNFIKGWGRVCLGSFAGAVLGAVSFVTVKALIPRLASAIVDDSLNAADVNFRVGSTDIASMMVSLPIMQANNGEAT